MTVYIISLAFGPTGDRAALAILAEAIWTPTSARDTLNRPFTSPPERAQQEPGWLDPESLMPDERQYWRRQNAAGIRDGKPPLLVQHTEPAPARATLRQTAEQVLSLRRRHPLMASEVVIVADCTACGPMAAEMMAEHGLWAVAIVRGGERVRGEANSNIDVPDADVEWAVRQALAENRLRIAAELPGVESLIGRLRSLGGGDGADEGRAVACAVWYRDWNMALVDATLAGVRKAPDRAVLPAAR